MAKVGGKRLPGGRVQVWREEQAARHREQSGGGQRADKGGRQDRRGPGPRDGDPAGPRDGDPGGEPTDRPWRAERDRDDASADRRSRGGQAWEDRRDDRGPEHHDDNVRQFRAPHPSRGQPPAGWRGPLPPVGERPRPIGDFRGPPVPGGPGGPGAPRGSRPGRLGPERSRAVSPLAGRTAPAPLGGEAAKRPPAIPPADALLGTLGVAEAGFADQYAAVREWARGPAGRGMTGALRSELRRRNLLPRRGNGRPMRCGTLADVRANIDRVDEQIVELLAERAAYVAQAAGFKRDAAEVAAPDRVAQVIAGVRGLALARDLDPELVEAIYRPLIAAFTHAEGDLRDDLASQDEADAGRQALGDAASELADGDEG